FVGAQFSWCLFCMICSHFLMCFPSQMRISTHVFSSCVQLFRHGDRSPVQAYPTDSYQESSWPQGFGQLSQEGMRQHFELGQYLRSRYRAFLNESYDRHEIMVRSTDYDRTLMSAEANLAGLYPPQGGQVFRPGLKWQPIPVHTVPLSEEKLLSFPMHDCPRYKQLMNETTHTEEFIKIITEYKDFLHFINNKTGLKNISVENVWVVYDTLFCESRHNMTPPAWVTPDTIKNLSLLKDFSFQAMFGVYKQQEKSRLQGGLLLGAIVKNLSRMAIPDPKQRLKVHDTTLSALQTSMNIYNNKQPPYASCQMIELRRDDNGSSWVSMFYRNDSSKDPYPLQLPGCSQLDCPLEEFIRLTKASIPEDRDRECELTSSDSDKEIIIGLALSACVLLFLIILLLTIFCWKREPQSSHGYQHVVNVEAAAHS
uniref:Lysosomal acid phosphatase n=1 Tax=Gouania willdenowi TaxID=441366 RepID=A0A8C5G2L0_GOUWI